RRRHTRSYGDWSSDVCSSDLSRYGWALIPLPARIFAVADAFDAMTNAQPYREALTPDAAVAEIEAKSEAHFDPQVVAALFAWHRSEERRVGKEGRGAGARCE